MTSIRETAKAIVAEMEGTGQECNLSAGKYFKRFGGGSVWISTEQERRRV